MRSRSIQLQMGVSVYVITLGCWATDYIILPCSCEADGNPSHVTGNTLNNLGAIAGIPCDLMALSERIVMNGELA